jgi:hypothetical protein
MTARPADHSGQLSQSIRAILCKFKSLEDGDRAICEVCTPRGLCRGSGLQSLTCFPGTMQARNQAGDPQLLPRLFAKVLSLAVSHCARRADGTCCKRLFACSKGPSFMDHPHLLNSIVTLIARITKLCWFAGEASRNIVTDAKQFLNSSPELYRLGLLLLKTVVQVQRPVTACQKTCGCCRVRAQLWGRGAVLSIAARSAHKSKCAGSAARAREVAVESAALAGAA